MNTLPTRSTPTPVGKFSWALVAAAPSPENPEVPVPAIVLMTPAAARAVPPNTTVTTTTTTQTKPERRTCSMLPPRDVPRGPLPRGRDEFGTTEPAVPMDHRGPRPYHSLGTARRTP